MFGSICFTVCLQRNSKTNVPKVFRVGIGHPRSGMIWVERAKFKVKFISAFLTLMSAVYIKNERSQSAQTALMKGITFGYTTGNTVFRLKG